ncbi:MAG TPA: c-type cytochrome [Alloacidobacterium sp.]|nr:c-type cytochrome [Alloacidobacterium sp.]
MKRFHTAAFFAAALVFTPAAVSTATAQAAAANSSGAQSYAKHCSICHGDQRQGNLPAFPPLLDIGRQLKEQQIADIVHTGRGRMPAFPTLQGGELTALLHFLTAEDMPAAHASSPGGSNSLAEAGGHLFLRNCAFCHGRDAGGGESGPDLTRSKLVAADQNGDKIGEVVRNGRPEKKMPAFNFSSDEIQSLAAFIHSQRAKASAHPGGRRGVDVADLQTGNVEAGKAYFNGAGGCSKCHSPTGDLAGIASRFEGLQLEEQMLYPRDAKSHVTVTLPSGEKVTGELAYLDEFTVGLRDSSGTYRSWSVNRVHYKVDAPVEAHAEQFPKYTDADIHNLMAYLQTLR